MNDKSYVVRAFGELNFPVWMNIKKRPWWSLFLLTYVWVTSPYVVFYKKYKDNYYIVGIEPL